MPRLQPIDPLAPWRLGLALWTTAVEAQTVMALRLLGLWGVLPARRGEDRRMVAEKAPAFARAALASAAALHQGPVAAAEAALRPIGRRTRANARRLTRPPRKPA